MVLDELFPVSSNKVAIDNYLQKVNHGIQLFQYKMQQLVDDHYYQTTDLNRWING